MEATLVEIGGSLGVKVPEAMIKSFDLKAGTKIEINFIRDSGKKSQVREGWDAAFSQYVAEGEDKQMLPDFLDMETDEML